MLDKIRINQSYLCGGLAIISAYFALYTSYLHENSNKIGLLRYVMTFVAIVLYLFTFRAENNREKSINRQLRIANIVIIISLLLMIPALKTYISDHAFYPLFSWLVTLAICLSNLIYDKRLYLAYIRKKHYLVLLSGCIGIIILLFSKQVVTYYLWDSSDMFRLVDNMDNYSLFNFSELSLSRHISYSFSALCAIFKIITGGEPVAALTASGLVLYVIGVYGFYRCVNLFGGNNKGILNVILTLLYAFSPYMLGMMTYSYPDYAIWCVTPILIYELYASNYYLVAFVGLFYLFIKETAIISYAFLLLGNYVVNAIRNKKMFYEFNKYVFMTIPCLLWLFSYIAIDHWGGNGGFGIQTGYVRDRLLADFAINFNWLLIVIFMIFILFRRKDCEYSIVPILTSAFAYTIFSVLFRTIIHPRYVDALVAQIYILTAYAISSVKIKFNVKMAVSSVLTVLVLIQSFFTIDPIMYKTFTNIDVGYAKLITTSEVLSDGMAYNRQYQGWGKIIDIALADVVNRDNSVIYMPALDNNTWHFNAMSGYGMLDDTNIVLAKERWDNKKRTRMTSMHDDEKIEFVVCNINSDYSINLKDGEHGFLLYSALGGNDIAAQIKEEYSYDETQYNYRGWNIKRLEFWK